MNQSIIGIREYFQNSLIEHTVKAAFQASDLVLKAPRPLLSVSKTDHEVP